MTKQMLWRLRQEISLNSMYYSDYRNLMSIPSVISLMDIWNT